MTDSKPTKAELDDRAAELADREAALAEREQEVNEATVALAALPDRQSIDEVVQRDAKGDNPLAIRSEIETGKKFPNVRPYLERYQDKKLFWVNEFAGDVARWIGLLVAQNLWRDEGAGVIWK